MTKTVRTSAALSFAACLLLTSCGGGGNDDADGEQTLTPTPTPSVTLPPGVELTTPGTVLSFGESATVQYSPNQSTDTVLTFSVTGAALGLLSDLKGFNLDTEYKKNANYYFVDVSVENVGEVDLGGRDVPLAGVNAEDTLLPPVVFQSAFKKCPSKPLPKAFPQGARFETCLVFLSPDKGELTAVSTLTDGTVEPVTWTGEITQPEPEKKPGKQGNQDD